MSRAAFCTILISLWVLGDVAAATSMADSVVRIAAVGQNPDYKTPWNPGEISSGVGAGFVVAGNRIMTNAHVVSNARYITVSHEGDPRPYPARVQFVAHDCDLALLTVEDPRFFRNTKPLEFGGIPAIESTVSVYGFPIGGDRMSVTRGVVSRIDFQPYSHSGVDSHLAIQIDAAINPGNSGGPVLQNGKVIGVAFQGYSGDVAQNVGYMIPTPVIRRFLKDVEDGKYDRYVDLAISTFPLYNRAARGALGLPDNDIGVFVGDVYGGGAADGHLRRGDVLLAIDGYPIASDGNVLLENDGVPLAEIVERKLLGDKVELEIWRDRQAQKVSFPLSSPWPFQMQSTQYDLKPRFVVFGGLIFQPLDRNFATAQNPQNLRLRYLFEHFISDHLYKTHPEPVVLSGILADPINAYLSDYRFGIVDEINGAKILRLEDVAEAFAKPEDYYVIKLLGEGRPIVLERKEVEAARDRIRQRYGVRFEQNLTP